MTFSTAWDEYETIYTGWDKQSVFAIKTAYYSGAFSVLYARLLTINECWNAYSTDIDISNVPTEIANKSIRHLKRAFYSGAHMLIDMQDAIVNLKEASVEDRQMLLNSLQNEITTFIKMISCDTIQSNQQEH